MTLKSETRVGLGHAFAVVYNLYGSAASIDHQHLNIRGAGVNSVLHKLLYHACRTLNHLPGSNLVCHRVG